MRDLLLSLYDAAVAGAAPRPAVIDALRRTPPAAGRAVHVVALGKAAHAMAGAAVEALAALGMEPAGGLVVGAHDAPAPHPRLHVVTGDHPVPGEGSARAADALGEAARRVGPEDEVLVLLSGGTSSLVAAPVEGLTRADLAKLTDTLLGAGAPIAAINAIRRRVLRWGGGRLAVALAPATVRCLAVSDVEGDDPTVIGSGPCVPDPCTGVDVERVLDEYHLRDQLTTRLLDHFAAIARGEIAETPKADHAAFARVSFETILSNAHALRAAADAATGAGLAPVTIAAEPLDDDAALTGHRLVDELIRFKEGGLLGADDDAGEEGAAALLWGGETTVALGLLRVGYGGRCQELALAAARALHEAGDRGAGITLLAAGTDGRDGPTDAAGAIVDAETWRAIVDAGRDPDADLMNHDAGRALEAVGALVGRRETGTNVRDVVIGVVGRGAM